MRLYNSLDLGMPFLSFSNNTYDLGFIHIIVEYKSLSTCEISFEDGTNFGGLSILEHENASVL